MQLNSETRISSRDLYPRDMFLCFDGMVDALYPSLLSLGVASLRHAYNFIRANKVRVTPTSVNLLLNVIFSIINTIRKWSCYLACLIDR